MKRLLEMLQTMRPHNSNEEKKFCAEFITNVYPHNLLGPMENIVINIGDSKTLFSCHTDTVHTLGGTQKIVFDIESMLAYKEDNACLGADDTVGVWLMLNMIDRKVPGTYVFHRGEERGCIGSKWIASEEEAWLGGFDRAIALDRKGDNSVITKQRGRSCCSDIFATALAGYLGPNWRLDPTGAYTDTAEYTPFIPECTNLSVGYYDQHSKEELQDLAFAVELLEKLVVVPWETLPIARIAAPEPTHTDNYNNWTSRWSHYNTQELDSTPVFDYNQFDDDELYALPLIELTAICEEDPDFAAQKLTELLSEVLTPALIDEHSENYELLEGLRGVEETLEIVLSKFESQTAAIEARLNALEKRIVSTTLHKFNLLDTALDIKKSKNLIAV